MDGRPASAPITTNPLNEASSGLLSHCRSFANGLGYSLIQEPYDGVRQDLEQAGLSLGAINVASKPAESDWSGRSGDFVGSIAEFCLVNEVLGRATGLSSAPAMSTHWSEALRMGATGGLIAAVTPVSESGTNDNFALDKGKQMADALASYGVFGAVVGRANELGFLGRSGFRNFISDATVYGVAGAASGVTGADIHSLLTTGHAASLNEIATAAAKNAAFGFGIAAVSHILPQASDQQLKPTDDGLKTSPVSTADWVENHYDGALPIRSPILTWLAEHNPGLSPPNYAELRARAWTENNSQDLSLSDWTAQKRPAVVAKLRQMGGAGMKSDAQIDAFINSFVQPDLTAKLEEYNRQAQPSAKAYDTAKAELSSEIAKHPELKGLSPMQLIYDSSEREKLSGPEYEPVLARAQDFNTAQINKSSELTSPSKLALDQSLKSTFNGINQQLGLPSINFHATTGQEALHFEHDIYLGTGDEPKMTSGVVERAYHEYTHHTQGTMNSTTLPYMLKYPFYMLSKKLGWIDEIPTMQATQDRQGFIDNYVGSSIEKQAYSLGLLTRIRAIAAGLPSEAQN